MTDKGTLLQTAPPKQPVPAHSGKRVQLVLSAVISVVILCAALWFLHHEFAGLKSATVFAQIHAIPGFRLLAALIFTACGYFVLTGFDTLGMQYIGRKLSYRHTTQTAFMAFAVGHNVGVAALSGGSIRYRMYSLLGLSGFEIAKLILFASTTFALGASLLLGNALLLMPSAETGILKLSPALLDSLGFLLLSFPVIYLLATFFIRAPVSLGRWTIALPSLPVGITQVVLSVADLSFACAALYVLLAPELQIGFPTFLGIYLIAIAAGLLSSVPGGIGVFEAVLLLALPEVDRSVLLGTVIVYRVIYYILPLAFALLLLMANEIRQHRQLLGATTRKAAEWTSAMAPQVMGLAVFLAGVVLLISGSTPAVDSRLNLIARVIPLPVLEISHLAGSVLGVGLLVLARGLSRRLRSAYLAAIAVLIGGAAVSILKGLDIEEVVIAACTLGFLWLSRDEFYRRGSVLAQRFSPLWIGSIVLVLCITIWVALVSFRHVPYSNELWWQFAIYSDAPRVLRTSLFAGMAIFIFALWKLLRPVGATLSPGVQSPDMDEVRALVNHASQANANAALMGDKQFLWSDDRQAFIMYQVSGDSWIALGDPVGADAACEDLAWEFREMVDRHDGRPVFYEVSAETLPMYVDMGLAMAKLGEDGRVPLDSFTLEGSKFAEFRQALNKARKQGATFEILPATEVGAITEELRSVSDEWLQDKATSEKGFSLGAFSAQYISNFDCAVVRVDGAIVAFANLWPARASAELSIDMMRYNKQAPKGIMDYLFTELMLWGKSQGFAWFSLGMAPLSGLEKHELAPLWHKIGHLIFSHGEAFYNFEGLRHYKEKFDPEWRPRYMAFPQGMMSLARSLLDTSRLISGGVTRILKK